MIETLTLLLVILTGVYAYLTYRIMSANQDAVGTMRAQMIASIRPYVYFDLVTTGPLIEGLLRNTGVSAAYNVTVSLEPAIQAHIGGAAQESSLIGKPVSLMTPKKEIREFFGSFSELESTNASLQFVGAVTYFDSEQRKFSEPFIIDLSSRKNMPYIGRTTIEAELKKLNEQISAVLKR